MVDTAVAQHWRRIATCVALTGLLAVGLPACTNDAADATAVVRSYLDALARGDANAALTFGATTPLASPMPTNQALTAAFTPTPIEDVDVGAAVVTGDTAQVVAHYTLGDQKASHTFTLTSQAGGWRIDRTYATVTFDVHYPYLSIANPWSDDI